MNIGRSVKIQFALEIDDASRVVELNADIFRIFELLKATLGVHSHKGFHVLTCSCSNLGKHEGAA